MSQAPLTPEQMQQALDLVAEHGDTCAAARAVGMAQSTFSHRWRKAKAWQAQRQIQAGPRPIKPDTPDGFEVRQVSTGYDAEGNVKGQWVGSRLEGSYTETVPDGHIVKGMSTLVDEQGKTRAQWIKTGIDPDHQKAASEAAILAAIAERVQPLDRIPTPAVLEPLGGDRKNKLTLYTMTDCHVGMLAWGLETGAPWDLDIAERCLVNTLTAMIDAAPESAVGVLNQLGDFLHFDSMKPLTPEHGHVLDADSRYQKVVKVAVRVIIRVIRHMLTKHDDVWVLLNEGNHDPAGSVWLRVMFELLFRENPRVHIEDSPLPYVVKEWGCNMLGFHHGHLAKKEKLPLLFASHFAEIWGRTTNRHIHTGHYHCIDEKEHPGVTVLQHPTLAAPDAYAIRGGWISKRQAMSITYHKTKGQIGRGIFLPTE